jgi:hypothetical protein
MKKITLFLITLLTFQLASITPIAAQVYKYVDKNGVPHYTNTPNDPRYQKSKIKGTAKGTAPKKKYRPTIRKENKYIKPAQTSKSSTQPRPH